MTVGAWLLVVQVAVNPLVEDEWNRWYDETHLPEIAGCPGFVNAARYVSEQDGERLYLSIYELTGPEAVSSCEFTARRGWAHFADDVLRPSVQVYRRITPPLSEAAAQS